MSLFFRLNRWNLKFIEDELEGCCKVVMFLIELVVVVIFLEEDEVFLIGVWVEEVDLVLE